MSEQFLRWWKEIKKTKDKRTAAICNKRIL